MSFGIRGGFAFLIAVLSGFLISCGVRGTDAKQETQQSPEVGVVEVSRKSLQRSLLVSSELVPFQQIDVYAKESGFVRELNVDYGTSVKAGEVMAVLEIPELREILDEDEAEIKDAASQIDRTQGRAGSHGSAAESSRISNSRGLTRSRKPIAVWSRSRRSTTGRGRISRRRRRSRRRGRSLSPRKASLSGHKQNCAMTRCFSTIRKFTAPFTGVVTKRYANQGTLMQSGINSSTQAMALVQLSEDDMFRLVIPVSESYVPYIRIGDPVDVRVPVLNRTFPGKVARFSVDVEADTRTMHTEVDVPNPDQACCCRAMYAEATLRLDRRTDALAVPQEAVNIEGDNRSRLGSRSVEQG